MEPRGRGRGWGRARGAPGGQQQQQPRPGQQQQQQPRPGQQQQPQMRPGGSRQQPPAPRAGAPGGENAWVRPQVTQPQWPRPPPTQAPQQPMVPMGRGGRADESLGAIPRRVIGEGEQGTKEQVSSAARGGGNNVRGRVVNRSEILFTKPSTLTTKQGNAGKPIPLLANYFPIIQNGKWCLFQYRVDFNPDIDETPLRKRHVRTATKDLLRSGYLFDGTVLYTPQRIVSDTTDLFVQDDNGENIRITIRLVGDLAWGDSHYVQLFNIIIRKCLTLMGLQLVGRNYFMPENKFVMNEHGIQLWPGYFTSMRQHEHDILLNVDLQFKFMRTDNVYDLLLESRGPRAQHEFRDAVIGSVVLTYYNNKTYRIDDIDFQATPMSTFKKRDGSEISYRDYYQLKYKVAIKAPDQPMLISRSKLREIRAGMPETVYLVPELCQMTGLSDRQRSNLQLMRQLATHTRVGVKERIDKLMDFSRKLHSKPEVVEEIRRWDLNVAESLVKIQGRVLPMEQMLGGNGAKYGAGQQADWTRDVRSTHMFYGARMDRLAVICPSRLRNGTQDFLQTLAKTASGMRWSIGNPQIFDIPDDRSGSYLQKIDSVLQSASPTMFFVILTNDSQDRYSAIKKKCFVDRGISSQMFLARNLNSKGVMSIATKVAIQMNVKIGGAPWSVVIPLSNLMVVGYDVCRDTVNKKKSFSGMVATIDRQMTRYFSYAVEHEIEQELSDNFAAFLLLACKKYKEVNGNYPDRILIYRDGVGIGQLNYVYEHEVVKIKNKLKEEIYKDTDLKLAVVVVSKRINTRILTTHDNPPPGTVVDDVITLPESYDFFLVSQCVRQGTVAPTNYNVIEDTLGLTANQLQILTHKLCHMYYNWSGTVRVPAPCQYAHKQAFMVSQHLHRPPHPELQTVLYFM